MVFRFHVLAVSHTATNKEYLSCAFSQKCLKLCAMLHRRGHIVYHYGHEASQVECFEHITVTTQELLEATYGKYDIKKEFYKYNTNDLTYKTFTKNAIVEVGKRKQNGDFLLCFWEQKEVAAAFPDMLVVRPGIGSHYLPVWAPYNIWESYCVMNNTIQFNDPSWYDCVIPNFFDLTQFEYRAKKSNYLLFMARIIVKKGLRIAVDIAIKTGMRLIVAGQGNYKDVMGDGPIPPNIEIVGSADEAMRKELLAGAKAYLLPTYYSECFGGSVIEAGLSGTPVITTDWGAFSDIVIHGKTGYRARTMEQFVWAVKNIDNINPQDCRDWCASNFSMDRVVLMYEEYFYSIYHVKFGKGFYHENPERTNLDWLVRKYPMDTELRNSLEELSQQFNQMGNKWNQLSKKLIKSEEGVTADLEELYNICRSKLTQLINHEQKQE